MKKLILEMYNIVSNTMDYVNFEDVQKFSLVSDGVVQFTYKNGSMENFQCENFDYFINRLHEELTNDSSGIVRF